ncbi:MAG: DUF308 domain-containing protein [bacterium]|nr:DUF308 domain-containing protein [bacterium]
MLQKINKFLNSSIVMAILTLLMGLIFIIFPKTSFETITYIIAAILIINGVYFIIEKNNTSIISGFLSLGIIELLVGIVILLNPNIIKTLFPILIGIVMITKSSLDIRLSLSLKEVKKGKWFLLFICALLSIICGGIIIINPSLGSLAITTYIGIVLVVYSITNIIDTIILKKHINDIVKVFK